MSLIAEPQVGAGDRLSFTIFVAVALHALLIVYDFIHEDPSPAPFTMEITLARYDDQEKPDKADFLAETNQQGSGQLEEKAQLTSPTKSVQPDTMVQQSSSLPKKTQAIEQTSKSVIVTQESQQKRASLFDKVIEQTENTPPKPRKSILERSLEIAELEASLDSQIQNYARRPRVTRLTAASTMKAIDARYVETVVSRIEQIGKLHFPKDGGKPLYGKPRISIEIYADGSIRDIKVLQSSGNFVLDNQTLEIVRRAAPFSPFPKEVRKERDVLELIRTFSYQKSGVSSY